MSQPVDNQTTEVVENPGQEVQDTEKTETTSQEMTVDQYKAELSKVRAEAASRRVALREQEEQAKKWKEYEESQKTELQKLQDQLAEKEKALAAKDLDVQRAKVAREFNVADEDLDLLVGDEDNMRRLASRLGKPQETASDGGRPADLLAGNRGKPIGSTSTHTMDDWIRGKVK